MACKQNGAAGYQYLPVAIDIPCLQEKEGNRLIL